MQSPWGLYHGSAWNVGVPFIMSSRKCFSMSDLHSVPFCRVIPGLPRPEAIPHYAFGAGVLFGNISNPTLAGNLSPNPAIDVAMPVSHVGDGAISVAVRDCHSFAGCRL